MALQDPQSGSGDPFLDWYYSQGNPQASVPEYPMPGAPSLPPPPPPPPPQPEKPKQIGGMAGVIETAAAPAVANDANSIDPNLIEMEPNTPPADSVPSNINLGTPRAPSAANLQGDPSTLQSMQPGLGIPSSAFDSLPPLPPTEPPPVDLTHEAGTSPFTSPTRLLDNQDQAFGNLTDAQRVDQQYADLRKMDPTKAALLMADREQARKDFYDARMAEIARHDREEQQRLLQQRMAAEQKAADDTKQLHADAMALANTKIIRDRRSAGQTLGDVFVAALGGLISARTGGPNVGLQMVMKGLDDDVQNQKDEIQQKQSILGLRRNFIADELARGKDLYQAQETYRLAMLEGFKQDALTEANKFDPLGTQAQRRYQMVGQIEAEQRKAVDAYNAHQLDMETKRYDLLNKQADLAKKIGALTPQTGGTSGAAETSVVPRDQLLKQYGWDPGKDMSMKDYRSALEVANKAGDVRAKQTAERIHDDETRVGQAGEFVYAKDGQGHRAGEQLHVAPDQAKELNKMKGSVDTIVHLMDDVRRLRTGWSNSAYNRTEYQRIKADWELVKGLGKDLLGLGALSADDYKLLEGTFGADDPTSFLSKSVGIEKARSNTLKLFSNKMRSAGWDSTKDYSIPDTSKGGRAPTEGTVDKLGQGAQARNFNERHEAVMRAGGGGTADVSAVQGDAERMRHLNALGFAADNPDPKQRDQAIALLEDAAENGPTDLTKQYARHVLEQIRSGKPGAFAAAQIQGAQ